MGVFECFCGPPETDGTIYQNKEMQTLQAKLRQAQTELYALKREMQDRPTVSSNGAASSREVPVVVPAVVVPPGPGSTPEVAILQQQNQKLQAECQELKAQVSDMLRTAAETEQQRDQALQKLSAVQQQAGAQADLLDDLYQQTASFLHENGCGPAPDGAKVARKGVDSAGAGFSSLTGLVQDLQAKVQRLEADKQAADAHLASLKAEMAQTSTATSQSRSLDVAPPVATAATSATANQHLDAARNSLHDSMLHAASLEDQLLQLAQENVRLAEENKAAHEAAEAAARQAMADREALKKTQAALEGQAEGAAAAVTAIQEQLQEAEAGRRQVEEQLARLREEVQSHTLAADGTVGQVDKLLLEINSWKKRHAELEAHMRAKDEMMGVLQQELAEVTELDLDPVVKAAVARQGSLARTGSTAQHMSRIPQLSS